MGPVNWLAVVIAWLAAGLLGVAVYGRTALPSFRMGRDPARHAVAAALLFVSAAMMGHMFARVGEATLADKPWLYFMMSGGLALTFAGPALFISYARRDYPLGAAVKDYAYWVGAYLLMGAVFWGLG